MDLGFIIQPDGFEDQNVDDFSVYVESDNDYTASSEDANFEQTDNVGFLGSHDDFNNEHLDNVSGQSNNVSFESKMEGQLSSPHDHFPSTQDDDEFDFSKYRTDTNDPTEQSHNNVSFKATQGEINDHISKAKHDIAHEESTIRHHASIAQKKASINEAHSNEDYQISQAQDRLEKAKAELWKWQHTKPTE